MSEAGFPLVTQKKKPVHKNLRAKKEKDRLLYRGRDWDTTWPPLMVLGFFFFFFFFFVLCLEFNKEFRKN
jgi:hypothetical protein